MSKNYVQLDSNKWYATDRKDIFICCDCSLVHEVEFKIVDGKLFSKWKRNDKKTASYRKAREAKDTLKSLIKKK